MDTERFSDFALLDAVPGEVSADELSILTLDDVQAVAQAIIEERTGAKA